MYSLTIFIYLFLVVYIYIDIYIYIPIATCKIYGARLLDLYSRFSNEEFSRSSFKASYFFFDFNYLIVNNK